MPPAKFMLGIAVLSFIEIVILYEIVALWTGWIPTVSMLFQAFAKMNITLAVIVEASILGLLFLLSLHLLGVFLP